MCLKTLCHSKGNLENVPLFTPIFYFVCVYFSELTMDYRLFLPKDEDDLNLLSGELCDKPTFQEVTTKSPGYKKVSLLPVFAVPGLGLPALTPLLEQLIHPAFCCSLPVSTKYLEKYTEDLLEVCLSSYTVVSWLPGKNTGSLLQVRIILHLAV